MSYTQHWFIENRVVGSGPATLERIGDKYLPPRQWAFCCRFCGEVWARRTITPATPWYFWTKNCANCVKEASPSEGIPGSIYLPWEEEGMDTLPVPLYHREAILHLQDIFSC